MKFKSFRPKFGAVAQALPLGISSFFTQTAIVLTSGVSNMFLVKYGIDSVYGSNIPVAVMGIVMKVFAIVISIAIGLAIVATIIFELFPHVLIRAFGNEGENYVAFAVLCFRIYLCLILFTCFQKSAGVFLQAIGKPIQSIIVSIGRDLLFQFPAMMIMSSLWGIMGLLWAALVADLLAFIVTFIFIALQMKHLTKAGDSKKNLYI